MVVESWTRPIAVISSSLSAIESAFRFSGRLSVIRATGPSSAYRRSSNRRALFVVGHGAVVAL